MAKVKRNSKAHRIFQGAINCKVHSLDNGFIAKELAEYPIDPEKWMQGEVVHTNQSRFLQLEHDMHRHAYLSYRDRHYVLHIHDNLWYEFDLE
jgi:hypothetical protein